MASRAILLGIAQDGGIPQAGCRCRHCLDPTRHCAVTCLGIVDDRTKRFWMVDATPDFRAQLATLITFAGDSYTFAGIILTHAHTGHYTGLIHLGREAWNRHRTPVYVTDRMATFLSSHAPWSQLIDDRNIELRPVIPGQAIPLGTDLQVTPITVPHRDEWSDTVAVIVGARRHLFYCPDIDSWAAWDRSLADFLATIDVALLDGTFFSAEDLPGRDLSQIPHPAVTDTVRQLGTPPCRVHFVHLNHSNPLLVPGPERTWLQARGFDVARQGESWSLG